MSKTKEVIGEDNITEYIEPSAGAGVFLDYLDKPYLAYDIEPEDSRVVEQDYLKLELDYKEGRCVIGNPPYGNRNNMSRAFYKKSTNVADSISFILPISQLNNTSSLYEFDLVHSEDLGLQSYSDRDIHCCLNIYKRPENGQLNKKKRVQLDDLTIYRDDYKKLINGKTYEELDSDLCIFRRGASIGKIKKENTGSSTFKFVIHNESIKQDVIDIVLSYDWSNYKNHQSAPCMSKEDVYNILKTHLPKIK